MSYYAPPIVPYNPPTSTPPPLNPLKPPPDLSAIEPYLPTPYTTFLPESLLQPTHPHLPHVTLTYAQSLDSQLALAPGFQTVLSGPETKAMTHYLRTRHDAILVGATTARVDDPGLTARLGGEGLESQPRPFVLGGWNPTGEEKVFKLAREGRGRAPWWIVKEGDVTAEGLAVVERHGGEVIVLGGESHWEDILMGMAAKGVRSVMIEGGAGVINGLLERRNQRFVSSVIVTIAPTYLGSGGVVVAPKRTGEENEVRLRDVRWVAMGQDVVMAGRPGC